MRLPCEVKQGNVMKTKQIKIKGKMFESPFFTFFLYSNRENAGFRTSFSPRDLLPRLAEQEKKRTV
jgi:hypothetical protein